MTLFVVMLLIILILVADWSMFKATSMVGKITVIMILGLCAILSLLPLENIPGPTGIIEYIFGLR